MPSRSPLALLAAALLLAGCASAPPPRQALNPGLQTQIASTEVIVGLPQAALFVQPPAKPVEGRDPQAEVAPLRAALKGYRFDQSLRSSLDQSLRKLPRLATRPADLQPQTAESLGAARLKASSADAVLLLTASYSMSPDFSRLDIGLRAQLMPRGAGLRKALDLKPKPPKELDLGEALYRNTIVFRSQVPEPGPDPLANRAQWLVDDAYPLHQALDDGLLEVTAALTEDLRIKPGDNRIGPALTDGYQRRRAPDGTLSIQGQASEGRPVQVEVVSQEPSLAAPTEIAPPEPLPDAATEMVEPGLTVYTGGEPTPPAEAGATDEAASPAPESAEPTPRPEASDAIDASQRPEPPPLAIPATPPNLSLSQTLSSPPSPPAPTAPSPPMAAPAGVIAPAAPVIAPARAAPPATALDRRDGQTRVPTPLRIRPTPAGAASSTLPPGTDIKLLGRTRNTTGEWLYLQGPNDSGWARSEEVQLQVR